MMDQKLEEMTHVHVEVEKSTKTAVAKTSKINTFSDCNKTKNHLKIAKCSQSYKNVRKIPNTL